MGQVSPQWCGEEGGRERERKNERERESVRDKNYEWKSGETERHKKINNLRQQKYTRERDKDGRRASQRERRKDRVRDGSTDPG